MKNQMPELARRVSFSRIRYANCWEDADVLSSALAPLAGRRVLSIASGGDNAFALLAAGASVVAADLSVPQIACVELKAAAFRTFSYRETLAFLGIDEHPDRVSLYGALAPRLTDASRCFWDQNRPFIASGIIHVGKFERYFHLFRRGVLPLIHSRSRVQALLAQKNPEERRTYYDAVWNNRRWRLLFRLFFSRLMMGRLGRDPAFFRYVSGLVAPRILERSRYALTELPTHDNPYLAYILEGNYRRALPPYLMPERYEALRAGLDRLTLVAGPIEEAGEAHAGGGFDGFNLSDIFEYLSEAESETLYTRLLALAKPGARLVYWNMLVPRECPESCRAQVRPRDDLAGPLFKRDRAFFYSRLLVDEVGGTGAGS